MYVTSLFAQVGSFETLLAMVRLALFGPDARTPEDTDQMVFRVLTASHTKGNHESDLEALPDYMTAGNEERLALFWITPLKSAPSDAAVAALLCEVHGFTNLKKGLTTIFGDTAKAWKELLTVLTFGDDTTIDEMPCNLVVEIITAPQGDETFDYVIRISLAPMELRY